MSSLALAVVAQLAGQALRDDQAHRGRDRVGLHTHVHQARQRLRRIVGMQRRQHQVARLRGLDRDLGRLEVADFADHDHVRILAQEGAQRRRERQADLRVDVDLVDARQLISAGSSAVEMFVSSVLRMLRPV